MSIYACILAEIEAGETFTVKQKLEKHPAVGMVATTAGPYDLFVLVRAESPARLGDIVVKEFQGVKGIRSTLTLVVLEELQAINWLEHHVLNNSET